MSVPAEVVALYWVSNVFLGLGAITYLLGGVGLWRDGVTNIAGFAALDDALKIDGKPMTKAQVYERVNACQDKVMKHLMFWSTIAMQTLGAFQTVMGIALFCVIFLNSLPYREAAHFVYFAMCIIEGSIEQSVTFGVSLVTDTVVKFGGSKPGAVAPEGSFPRPSLKGGFIAHVVLGLIHLTLGILTVFVDSAYPPYLGPTTSAAV